ncbi:MAG: nicotinate-nicotinamide nucleotide adenylyltransferase [Deltaproteobacteria bacterium]|nr:nicotinate-nicotinamide nucleotide adenylyltransferase [Deltaproteobacteria bacterium]
MTRIGPKAPTTSEAQRVVSSKVDAQKRAPASSDLVPLGPARPLQKSDDRGVLPEVAQKLEAALAYARAGKPRLAQKRLDDAQRLFEARSAEAPGAGQGLHPGLWNPLAKTSAAIEEAERSVAELAKTTPVRAGASELPKVVVIYGTSANPPTGDGGHAGIVRWGATTLRTDLPDDDHPEQAIENVKADEVWVLPVYRHAFSSKRDLIDFSHRFQMAKLGFESLPELAGKVQVKDTERVVVESAFEEAEKNGTPLEKVKVGTIDVIRHLEAENPGTRFVLALGGDTYRDLLAGKWKQGDLLLKSVPVAVVPRAGVDGVDADPTAPKLSDISSTKVRGSNDLSFLNGVLHPDVLAYMQAHELYAFAAAKTQEGN